MRCSVIIPTYNREQSLGRTLESLTRQRLPRGEFEVLVVDDGSSDGTAATVDGFRGRLDLRYFFQADQGFGVAKARNVGVRHAEGDVCVFTDAGMVLSSGFLQAHIACHESASAPQAVCGYNYCHTLDNEDAELIERTVDFDDPDTSIELLRGTKRWLDVREEFYSMYTEDLGDLPAPWLVYWGANASAPTVQVRSVGMFDEAFTSWGGEDLDLGYRLHRDGARFVLCRRAAAIHIPHDKSFDDDMKTVENNYRYMVRKYGTPVIELLATTPPQDFFKINAILKERGIPA